MKSLYDLRRDNLRHLIDTRFGGSQTKLAKAVGLKQPSFVSRLLTDREATRKNIGNELARKIERALGLSPNVLDTSDLELVQTKSVLFGALADRSVVGIGDLDAAEKAREPFATMEGGDDRVLLLEADVLGRFDSIASVYEAPPEGAERITTHSAPAPYVLALRLPDDSMGERFPARSIVVFGRLMHGPNDFVVGVLPGTDKACMRQWVEVADRSFLVPLNRAYPATEVTPDFKRLGTAIEATVFLLGGAAPLTAAR